MDALSALPGVKAVFPDKLEQPLTDQKPAIHRRRFILDKIGWPGERRRRYRYRCDRYRHLAPTSFILNPDQFGKACLLLRPAGKGSVSRRWMAQTPSYATINSLAPDCCSIPTNLSSRCARRIRFRPGSEGRGTHTTSTAGGNAGVATQRLGRKSGYPIRNCPTGSCGHVPCLR